MTFALLGLMAVLGLSTASGAAPPSPIAVQAAQTQVNLQFGPAPEDQKTDAAAVEAAIAAANQGGYAALAGHLAALETVLKHAPATYPDMAQNGERWIIHVDGQADAMVYAHAIGALAEKRGARSVNVEASLNIYPVAARILGSEALERQAYAEALDYFDRGLALQPYDSVLLSEKAVALQAQSRWTETLAMLDQALSADHPVMKTRPANLLRRRGYALIELGRLDEARRDYQEALRQEPDNRVAAQELEYIDQLQRGKAPTQMQILSCGVPNAPADCSVTTP